MQTYLIIWGKFKEESCQNDENLQQIQFISSLSFREGDEIHDFNWKGMAYQYKVWVANFK